MEQNGSTPSLPAAALIGDFGTYLGIDGLAFDAAGNCRLSFDDTILDFDIDPERDDFLVTAVVGRLDGLEEPKALTGLMELSLLGAMQGIGSLGLNVEQRQIVWFDRLPVCATTQPIFQAFVRKALDRVAYWETTILQRTYLRRPESVEDFEFGRHLMIRA